MASRNVKTLLLIAATVGALAALGTIFYLWNHDGGASVAGTVSLMATFRSAQDLYYERYGKYFTSWQTSIPLFGEPGTESWNSLWSIESDTCLIVREEYVRHKFELSANNGGYEIRSTPLAGAYDNRYYYLDETGIVRWERGEPASKDSLPLGTK